MSLSFALIADDFTGAMDAGVQFVQAGYSAELVAHGGGEESADAIIYNTASRHTTQQIACKRSATAAAQCTNHNLFKKVDSTLRGHVGAEIAAVLRQSRYRKAVLCSAMPSMGRAICNGTLFVAGNPLHQSEFAHDPTWPMTISEPAMLIGDGTAHLNLEVVRSGASHLIRAIDNAVSLIVSLDAVDASDLNLIAQAVQRGDYLPCGAMDLAQAWIGTYPRGVPQRQQSLPPASILWVVGSIHPVARTQVHNLIRWRNLPLFELDNVEANSYLAAAALLRTGRDVVVTSYCLRAEDGVQPEYKLAEWIKKIALASASGHLVCVGGETSQSIIDAIGTDSVKLLNEPMTGVVRGRINGGLLDQGEIITKAGGFGNASTLIQLSNLLHRESGGALYRQSRSYYHG